jgi:uncharacterized protein YlaI
MIDHQEPSCALCGKLPGDHEIVIREIRRRNVPLVNLHICRECALRMSANVQRRVQAS